MLDRRIEAELHGEPIWIVSPEDLILLNLIAGRYRDWGDIEVVRMMLEDMDEAYMRAIVSARKPGTSLSQTPL